jgi:hypothetical protein
MDNNKIEIIKNEKLDLPIPKFVCDGNICGEHLNKYPMLTHLNKFNTTCFLGRPASGKTSLMISLLTAKGANRVLYKAFDKIIVVMPSSSRASLKVNPFRDHPKERLFDELNIETMTAIYNMIEEHAEDKQTTLLIMDDVGSDIKNKEIQKILKKLAYNRRHLKLCQFFLLQSYLATPKDVRKLFSNIIIFKPSKIEAENIIEECLEQKKDVALDILQLYENPHDFLFLNIPTQQMYFNWDQVVIKDKE